jgi:protein gp37
MTSIEWTWRPGTKGESWNPIRARNKATGGVGHYCAKVSAGCENCYAERLQPRFNNPVRYAAQDRAKVDIYLDETVLLKPLRWRSPRTIFVCSMSDLFGVWVPDEWLDRIFAVMALCPQHTFQVLTKRPERMRNYLAAWPMNDEPDRITGIACDIAHEFGHGWQGNAGICERPLPNVWAGTSIEDQATADERIPHLLETPAAVRFVSAEPLLGPVDFTALDTGSGWIDVLQSYIRYPIIPEGHFQSEPIDWPSLDWVIAGSESGRNARTCDLAWIRSMRDQCAAARVAFFWKQHAERGRKISMPDLDGRKWTDFPQTTA